MPIFQCHCPWAQQSLWDLLGREISTRFSAFFWIRTCSQDIFITIKCTNSSTAEHSPSYISQRYSSDGKNIKENFNKQRHIDFSASTSGFCHKSEKISSETITTNRFFRSKNRYPHHDFGTNRGKDEKGSFEISESLFLPLSHCFGINKIDRSDVLNFPSSSARSSTAKVFTTTTNTITKPGLLISGRDSIKQSVKTGTYLVGGKFKIKQWKITKAKWTQFSDTNRCIRIRFLGPFATGCQLMGNGQKGRRTYIFKYSNALGDRQQDCIFISFENGGFIQQRTFAH